MTPDEMIAVIQAGAKGRQLQYALKGTQPTLWRDRHVVSTVYDLNFNSYDYRVKPEKKKLYAVFDGNDRRVSTSEGKVSAAALEFHQDFGGYPPYRVVTFVEE